MSMERNLGFVPQQKSIKHSTKTLVFLEDSSGYYMKNGYVKEEFIIQTHKWNEKGERGN